MTVPTVACYRTISGSDKTVMSRLLSILLLLLVAACEQPNAGVQQEDQDRCFEQYMTEFRGQYPKATLEKAAALKCYRN